MAVDVRLIQPEELSAWVRSVSIPFLEPTQTEELQKNWEKHWSPYLEYDRTWAAVDRGRFVGNCNVFSRTVSLPAAPGQACPIVPFAAVSGVGVHPTHRRQGILRRMMDAMLDDARRRGECLAGLGASESSIYGRFGYGVATSDASYEIDTRHAAFRGPVQPRTMELLDPAEAAKVLPALHDAACARIPGQVNRDDPFWKERFEDDPEERKGSSAMWYLTCEGGYAAWRTRDDGDDGGLVELGDLFGDTDETEAALWRFVLDLDLVRRLVARRRPVEEPLRGRLADPRALRTTRISDYLWLRVLDTPAALTARGYRRPGRLVLDVRHADEGDPAIGRWMLEAGPDGAECRAAHTAESTDLVLGLEELGAILAGGHRPSVLAAAGRIDEQRAGALDEADGLFASRPSPWSSTGF